MANILIADDSPTLLELFPIILGSKGHSVSTVSAAAEIPLAIKRKFPDVLLLDVRLGYEDGRQICADIKQQPATKNISIILLSGSHELLRNFKDYAADDILEKPFDIKTVTRKIEAVMLSCNGCG